MQVQYNYLITLSEAIPFEQKNKKSEKKHELLKDDVKHQLPNSNKHSTPKKRRIFSFKKHFSSLN